MITEYLQALEYWHWLVFAVALIVLEALAPGAIFMWMGVAAALVGVLMLVFPLTWEWQLVIFAVVSVASIVLWRRYQKAHPSVSASPLLNMRTRRYVGKVVTISSAIENGRGAARVGDTIWNVEGPDLPEGARARVVDAHGAVLVVEAANA